MARYLPADNEKEGSTLLLRLLEDEGVKNSVCEGIEKEEDLDRITDLMWDIFCGSENNREARLKLYECVMHNEFPYHISSKMTLETDVEKIGRFLIVFGINAPKLGKYLTSLLNYRNVIPKIEKERDVNKIGWCTGGVASADKELGLILTNSIDFDNLLTR